MVQQQVADGVRLRTVAVVLNFRMLAEAVADSVRENTELSVAATGSRGEDAVAIARVHQPDVMVIDDALPGPPTQYVLDALQRFSPLTRILMLRSPNRYASERVEPESARVWLEANKDESLPDLSDMILNVARRPERVTTDRERGQYTSSTKSSLISTREAQVLTLASDGLSNLAIGLRLSISPGTVKNHLSSIYEKLGVASRVEAMRRAAALGVIRL